MDRREGECPAHSGMVAKLNVQLLLGGIGLLLLSTLLALVIDTHATVKTNSYRYDRLELTVDDHGTRITNLERQTMAKGH